MPELEEMEERQRIANKVDYEREKLVKLDAIASKARSDLRMAKIEAEVAESRVETTQAMVNFTEAAVEHQRKQVELAGEGLVGSAPGPAPEEVSPPQDDPPGAGSPPASSPSTPPPPDPPPAPPPSAPTLDEAPAPKTRARGQWNMDRAREALRGKGVVKNADVAPLVGGIDAARLALNKLVELGEAQRTGQRGNTRYHRQEQIEDKALDTGASGQAEEPDTGVSGRAAEREGSVVVGGEPPVKERKFPVSEGPPEPGPDGRRPQPEECDDFLGKSLKKAGGGGRGRTAQSDGQEPSFQGLMHQRLIIKPMTIGQMMEEWPGRSEQEIRQALGENMKTGDVTLKRKGSETRYHGRS